MDVVTVSTLNKSCKFYPGNCKHSIKTFSKLINPFFVVSDVLSFNGSSLLRYDLLREPIETDRHFIRFRFKTNNADGVLMYSRGTQGDYIALQLKDNRMILNIDLGSGIMTSLSVGSLLDDNMWHDVLISRNRKNISFSVDRVLIKGRIKGEFHRLDLNRAVSN